MGIKFCPKCKNTDLVMELGGEIGIWRCKKCGFTGAIFPELTKTEIKKKQKMIKTGSFQNDKQKK